MSFDNERSIRRNGSNDEYQNKFNLPYASKDFRENRWGEVYLAGKYASGRRCAHPGCDRFISVMSHVRIVSIVAMPETHGVARDEYIGARWIHADHEVVGEGAFTDLAITRNALLARREAKNK